MAVAEEEAAPAKNAEENQPTKAQAGVDGVAFSSSWKGPAELWTGRKLPQGTARKEERAPYPRIDGRRVPPAGQHRKPVLRFAAEGLWAGMSTTSRA